MENKTGNNHCDPQAQKEMTEKLTLCDNETETAKDRVECYTKVTEEAKDKGACINS